MNAMHASEHSPLHGTSADWGPARHDPQDPRHERALAAWFDQRDAAGERPDDN